MNSVHDGVASSVCVQENGPDRPEPPNSPEGSKNVPTPPNEIYGVPGAAVDKETTSRGSAARPVRGSADLHEHDEEHGGDGKTVSSRPLLTVIVDNYDSFTYSIYQYFSSVNKIPPLVVRNDEFPSWEAVKKALPNIDNVVVSPGPGHPGNVEDFGISWGALQDATLPTLGICLGHQGFASVFGGKVVRAPEAVHGRKSVVDFLQDYDLFRGIEQGTTVLRYHSLVVERENLPACLEVTCWTRDNQRLIMGLRHKQLPLHGIQFHPESVGTADGFRMLENFRDISVAWWRGEKTSAVASAGLDDLDTLSRRLLRESRLAAVGTPGARRAGPPGGGGNEGTGEGKDGAAKRTEAGLGETGAGESACAAEAGGTLGTGAENAAEVNTVTISRLGWVVNVAVVPRAAEYSKWGGDGQRQQQQVKVEGDRNGRNKSWLYDQAEIFGRLFAKESVCFWLDSSSADETCAGVHARKHYSQRACVSYMGGCSGPFAEAVEYHEKEKKAILRYFTPEGKTTAVTVHQADLFKALATRLQRFSREAGIGEESGSDNNSGTPNNNNSSTWPSMSSSTGPRSSWSGSNTTLTSSGSKAVETRWWEMRDGVLQEVGDNGYLCCSTLRSGAPVATLQKDEVKGAAAALRGGDAEERQGSPRPSHAYSLPGFVGGYVGFFSYELRHLTQCYERVSTPALDAAPPPHAATANGAAAAAAGTRNNTPQGVTAAAATTPRKGLGFQADDGKSVTVPSAETEEEGISRERRTPGVQQKNTGGEAMRDSFKEEGTGAAVGESTADAGVKTGDQSKEEAGKGHASTEETIKEGGVERQQQPETQGEQKNCTRREKNPCDAVWVFADRVVAFDLESNTAYVLWLTLRTCAPASFKATAEDKEQTAQYEEGGRIGCEDRKNQKQRSPSRGPLVAAPAAGKFEEACACCELSPSVSTSFSVSAPSSLFSATLSTSDSLASSITENAAVEAAAEMPVKDAEKEKVASVAATGESCTDEEARLFDSIERVQLSWATQTVQELLGLRSVSHAASAAAGSTQSAAKAGGEVTRGKETAAEREDSGTEKATAVSRDEVEADRGVAATAAVEKCGSGESSNDGAGKGEATKAATGRSGRSGRAEGGQNTALGDADTQRKSKRAKTYGEEDEERKQENIEAAVASDTQDTCREQKKEQQGGTTSGETEKLEQGEGEAATAAAEASAAGLGCTDVVLQQAAESPHSLVRDTWSPFPICSSPSSSSSIGQQQERGTAWLLRPRETTAQYLEKIKKIFQFIASGDAYEVCLTTKFSGRLALRAEDIFQFYCFLRKRNPTPFSVFFRYQPPQGSSTSDLSSSAPAHYKATGSTTSNTRNETFTTAAAAAGGAVASSDPLLSAALRASPHDAATTRAASEGSGSAGSAGSAPYSFSICCASPELFLLLDQEGWLESRPIKGTRPRGRTPAADAALAEELRTSEKDAAENIMVVDVVRSDLGKVSVPGSVHVPEFLAVESYARVHQLVSTVRGKLRPELSFFDALAAAFPGASMTGAPKKRVMHLLDELEQRDRGVYSGAIGFLSVNQQAALNIPIRMLVFHDDPECDAAHSGNQKKTVLASLGTGGAILAGSNPEDEVEEMYLKADSVLSLLHEFLSLSNSASV